MDEARLAQAYAAIDTANAQDPETLDWEGEARPKELLHAELMTEWVGRLDPDADEAQLLAARAHHVRRWEVRRDAYPEGRAGYLRWRKEAGRHHAEVVASILSEVGYGNDVIERVQAIVRKEGLRVDPDVQTHEDALCLVFLQTQFAALAGRLGDEKTVDVVRRTLAKMSDRGRAEALALPLSPQERALVEAALAA